MLTKHSLESQPRIKNVYINSHLHHSVPLDEYYVAQLNTNAIYARSLNLVEVGRGWQSFHLDKGQMGQWLSKPITVELDQRERDHKWQIQHSPIVKDSSRYYKIGGLSNIRREVGQQQIERSQQRYQLYLEYDFLGHRDLSQIIKEQTLDSLAQWLPLGYSAVDEKGWKYKQDKSYGHLILMAIFIIFLIGAILFNSLKQSFLPLLLIPPSFIGIFITVTYFNIHFDQGGFAAFLLVAGLSVNAGYYIINDFNYYIKEAGIDRDTAFSMAFQAKFGPILLTVVSTILGLLPFVIGNKDQAFWYPLATCTIGGMLFSLIGVLIFFPLFFLNKQSPSP